MLEACVERGYEYFAITDHSRSLAMTGGLDEERLLEQWKEIDAVQERHPEIRILKSLEVDILDDGSLDLSDEMLERLDLVLVSVHSRFGLPPDKQTARILRALRHPAVNVFAHPTGRLINERDPYEFDLEEVLRCAADHSVAVELNANPARLDLRDTDLARARELGVRVTIGTDAHRARDLAHMRYGVEQARRAWLTREHVLNARPLAEFLEALRK
jgi:DNA polymerase (family 10)